MKTKLKKIDIGEYELQANSNIYYIKKQDDVWHLYIVTNDFENFEYVYSMTYDYINTFDSLKNAKNS